MIGAEDKPEGKSQNKQTEISFQVYKNTIPRGDNVQKWHNARPAQSTSITRNAGP